MKNIDRLLIGALVLGVWVLVAMQFFGLQVEVTNWPYQTDVTGGPTLWVLRPLGDEPNDVDPHS